MKRGKEVATVEIKERLAVTLESIGDGVISTDRSGTITLMNRAAENITGWNEEEAVGRPLTEVFPIINKNTRKPCVSPVEEVLETGRAVSLANHTVLICRDGTEKILADSCAPIRDNEGNIIGVVLAFRDVTKQRQSEHRLLEKLRESEKRYRDLFENSIDIQFIFDREGNYMEVNNEFIRESGYEREKIIGTHFGVLPHPDEMALVLDAYEKALTGETSNFEMRSKNKDGKFVWYSFVNRPIFNDKGEVVAIHCIARNIDEKKRAERALRESEEKLRRSEKRYRDLFDSVSDLIYTQDLEGRFMNGNRAMTSIFGYELEEFIGRKAADFMKPELGELFYTEYLEGIKKKGHYQGISSYFTKDGRKIYLEFRSNLIRPADGEPFISGIARDVTDRVLAQREIEKLNKQMLQAQKMEAIGTLAGGIAHDFNNLLQGILGYTQILAMEKDKGDPDIARLQQIEKAAHRASELTQQLLTFSRKVESRKRPVDLNHEVEQVEKILKRTIPKMIDIELNLEKNLEAISADPSQLEQIIMNLGVNARDAMPEGGKLLLETENVILDEEFCKDHLGARPGKYALLRISDTGIGMNRRTLEHIFDPFFTTKEVGKGTGLGLAMVYGIVKSHEGYIMCASEPGDGTTFKIYFPVMEGIPARFETEAKNNEATSERGSETILLVDDEEILRDIGRDILETFGYTVLLAPDGESALELYKERRKHISLVILDLIMPGMGGKQCLEKLLKINPDTKVVIASGYSIDGHAKDALKAGAKAFVSKPYELNKMLQAVRSVLDE
ncbi:MAG: hypothetical protein B1H13_03530 [Desulfobacteraceae bacterium 4484_190.3]|nr:MAG: hypothetical protein B1H13_03530 [Desulfobacteraceae bacterium 4484_190.3]